MKNSLLFLPDISGFTQFIQNTEVEHSQHVIAELLEVLISANTQDLRLAEVEGDALFFYKEGDTLSQEKLLAQIETMFTAFYSHLKMLKKNRICPCNACATAPELQLKIIIHCGQLQFIEVQGNRKPFGQEVIQAHRLMKNSVQSDSYVLISDRLAKVIEMDKDYSSKLFKFQSGSDSYDGKEVEYAYSLIDISELKLKSFSDPRYVRFDDPPAYARALDFPLPAEQLLEYLTNYRYRNEWLQGVDGFEYDQNEVTRLGSEHVCVIDGKRLNFITVTKESQSGELIYGELTESPPIADELYQFFFIRPLDKNSCRLRIEMYWTAKSPLKKLFMKTIGQKLFKKGIDRSIKGLYEFVVSQSSSISSPVESLKK